MSSRDTTRFGEREQQRWGALLTSSRQHDCTLVMPASSSRLRSCLPVSSWSASVPPVPSPRLRRWSLSLAPSQKQGDKILPPGRGVSIIQDLECFYKEDCPLSPFLFNHLFTSVWTYRYSFHSLDYNSILSLFMLLFKLFQLWPLAAPSGWLPSPSDLTHPRPRPASSTSSLSSSTGRSRLICSSSPLLLSASAPTVALVPLIGEGHLETKIWVPGVLVVLKCHCPQVPSVDRARQYTHIHTHI